MEQVEVHDKTFELFIDRNTIQHRISEIAAIIDDDYKDINPLFIGVLNGAFIFAADLLRTLTIPAEISFVKLASYSGTTSTGNLLTTLGLDKPLTGRHVVVIEDIIDTGNTLHSFLQDLKKQEAASIKVAAFLIKPGSLKHAIIPDYFGFEVPDKFLIGYGLDYDGLGRNLPDIYMLSNQ
jgi:hypoxanthine phosphoribosyltransferase